ncbi:hypothetical protein BGZ58_005265 [Dissophora ornata]|nr:hypothetical protein BGZ58_005265 [Dissophora ornata]
MERLKSDFSPSVSKEHKSDLWISSGDALAALLCGVITRARENAAVARLEGRSSLESQTERIAMAADGRGRAPQGNMSGRYFGNFNALWSATVSRSDLTSLTCESASRVALAIRNDLNIQLSPEAIADKISFFEAPQNATPAGRIAWTADVILTNWCQFDLQGPKLDFGWGKPFCSTPGGGSIFPPGYCLMTQEKDSGDVSVLMTVEQEAQSEADQLAETMATQAGCLTEGLRPCRRREKIRKRRAQRQRHLNSRIGGDKEEDMSAAAKGEYSEERTMDEVWRRHQRQRMERPEVDPISASVHSANMAQRVNCSSEGDSMGGAKNDRPLDELAAERLWEFVVGWCLIGCIFAGAALIIGAILRAHNGISGETPWTFDTEDGDSLMDSVVANVMRVALGVRDFGDQLMEHGIFVFVAGINGYVLVRQRVFVRRRLYEGDLSKAGTLPKEYPGKDFTLDVEQQVDAASCERYSGSHREYERAEEGQCNCVEAHPLGDCKFAGGPISMDTSTGANRKESGNIEDHRSLARENINSCQAQCEDDENDSPDFRTMSFLAWFNYLQVGILVIEFLQLFSFPLRELMEFYNQAEKTTAMYESAKTILNVFQAASSSPDRIDFFEPSRLRYHDGTLSLGNNTLFNFNLRNLSYQGDMADSGRAMVTSPLSSPSENTSSALALNPDLDWIRSMPTLDNATALAIPWIKNITASTEWIAETLPAWLPNITTLMTNSSITAAAQGNLEEIRGHLVNAAAEVAIQSLNLTRLSSGNITGALSEAESPKTKQLPKQMAGDSDIVMQIVNSLGLQPSINTRDWYLLRFWSCAFAVLLGWIVALSIHGWNRRCRHLRREGRPHSPAISVGWVSYFIPVVVKSNKLAELDRRCV